MIAGGIVYGAVSVDEIAFNLSEDGSSAVNIEPQVFRSEL